LRYANRTSDTNGYNIGLGYHAGDDITTGQYNTIIGSSADPSANSASNQTVIGYGADGQANNSVTLGNSDVTAVYMAEDKGAKVYSTGADFGDGDISNFSASTVAITSTTTLAQSTHNGKVLICNSSSDIDLDITKNTLSAGFNCLIIQKGTGEITIDGGSGVTVQNRNSHTKTANQWAIMTLICIDATSNANVFVSSGDGTS
jgi:hypothetical protein